MKKDELEMEDDLRPEYDLKSLTVRKLGSGRKSSGGATVRLEPDVAAIFPNADAVNEALRFIDCRTANSWFLNAYFYTGKGV